MTTNCLAENERILAQYSSSNFSTIYREFDIEKDKIINIQFEPFNDLPIKRKIAEQEAFQIKRTKDGITIFIEPVPPYPQQKMIFTQDIPEHQIKKGDTGTLIKINSGKTDNQNSFSIETDDKHKTIKVPTNSCVFDSSFKFLYFCKIHTAGKTYFSEYSINKRPGNFADDDNPVLYCIRYQGNPTKEILTSARMQFENKFPEYKKLEEKGILSVLLLTECPCMTTTHQRKNDAYRMILRKWEDLQQPPKNIHRPKIN